MLSFISLFFILSLIVLGFFTYLSSYCSSLKYLNLILTFLLVLFTNLFLLFNFYNLFNQYSLHISLFFTGASITSPILILLLLVRIFFRNHFIGLYFFILRFLKVTIIVYFISSFYLYINLLLPIIFKIFNFNVFIKFIYFILITYCLGIPEVSFLLLAFIMSDNLFYSVFLSLIHFSFVIIVLLIYYYIYFVYLFNLLNFKSYIFKPFSKVKSGKSVFSQSSFRNHSSYRTKSGKVFCNVFYPNRTSGFSGSSLLFNSDILGVNFYCTYEEYIFIKKLLYQFEFYDSKVGQRVSLVNFRLGAIVYMRICLEKGYSFVDREYFLTHFRGKIHNDFYNNSLLGNTFFDRVYIKTSPKFWLNVLDDNGIFKDSFFLNDCYNSDKFFNVLKYDISIVRVHPKYPMFEDFPLVSYNFLLLDLFLLESLLIRDRAMLNKFVGRNNGLVNRTGDIGYERESLRLLSLTSKDYELYLTNCKGNLGV